MPTTKIWQVDAFTDRPFGGNPAAVCLLEQFPSDSWMQNLAAEINLSETAFLVRQGANEYHLRWFTPLAEVELCGHATLASAHVLKEQKQVETTEPIQFNTLSGQLLCHVDDEMLTLNFPATPAERELKVDELNSLSAALGVDCPEAWANQYDVLVRVESRQALDAMRPNFQLMSELEYRGVITTCEPGASEQVDFVSRFFAPRVGVPEDPVTGSAHSTLAPYWARILGKNDVRGFQASKRGGYVDCNVQQDRVELRGQAVTVLECKLLVGR